MGGGLGEYMDPRTGIRERKSHGSHWDRGLSKWEDTALFLEGSPFSVSKPPARAVGARLTNNAELCPLWEGSLTGTTASWR